MHDAAVVFISSGDVRHDLAKGFRVETFAGITDSGMHLLLGKGDAALVVF
jgi:hypothetical protein